MAARRLEALWRRIGTPGHDACRIEPQAGGWALDGMTVHDGPSGPVALRYRVLCSAAWETVTGSISGWAGGRSLDVAIDRDGRGWRMNGAPVPAVAGMLDLDLSFTPTTNYNHLQRVATPVGEAVEIPVAWYELDSGELKVLRQIYRRLDERRLDYHAPDVGYRAVLEQAPDGLVRLYPELWERVTPA